MHALALPVHAFVALCGRFFGRAALVSYFVHCLLLGRRRFAGGVSAFALGPHRTGMGCKAQGDAGAEEAAEEIAGK